MKTLYLMRHAKSSWEEPLPDHERPLNKRGKKAAKLMGKYLAGEDIRPELILSSDAVRARETARRMVKAMKFPPSGIELEPRLYEAGPREIMAIIHALDPKLSSVLLIAHNPGISETAVALSGDESYEWLPTAAVVGIEFDIDDWKKVGERKGKAVFYAAPKAIEKR